MRGDESGRMEKTDMQAGEPNPARSDGRGLE
jgi:hypothetical protein